LRRFGGSADEIYEALRHIALDKDENPRARVQAMALLLAYGYGKPKQKVEVSDPGLTVGEIVGLFGTEWRNGARTFEFLRAALKTRESQPLGSGNGTEGVGPALGMGALPLQEEREGVLSDPVGGSPREPDARPDDPGREPLREVNVGEPGDIVDVAWGEPGDIVDVAWEASVPGDPETAGDGQGSVSDPPDQRKR
jgi:hypothetical protein